MQIIRINAAFREIWKRKYQAFITILQQTKEPYVTTYRKLYKVMEERHLKLGVFFYAVKQQTISFLLDCSKTY